MWIKAPVIGSITGNFVSNIITTTANSAFVQGGVIGNYANGTNSNAVINSITGDFIGNKISVSGSSSVIYGAVLRGWQLT